MPVIKLKDLPVHLRPKKEKGPQRTMNGWESEFSKLVENLKAVNSILDWRYEPLRLLIATGKKRAYYKPDFMSISIGERVTFYEVKGFWKPDSRLRIKVAAGLYPFFDFVGVTKENGEWAYEYFSKETDA